MSVAPKLFTDLRVIGKFFSRGLSYNLDLDIVHKQLLKAAAEFARRDYVCPPWWHIPFNQDPDTPAGLLPSPKLDLRVFLRFDEAVDEFRRMRDEVTAPIYRQYKDERKRIGLSYADEVEHSRKLLLYETYSAIEAIPQIGNPADVFQVLYWDSALEISERLIELGRVFEKKEDLKAFMYSEEFCRVPLLSVRAKLMAADFVYDSNRTPEPSLNDDFSIAATIIPYTNFFATENYLAELIRKTKVGNDFGCRVFTMRQKDEFLDLLLSL